MEVGQIVNVEGSSFIAVAAPCSKCQGCAGRFDSGSGIDCIKFPSCVNDEGKYMHFVRHNPAAQPWMPSLLLGCDIGPSIAPARKMDPATSKGKRRVNKYEQVVLDALFIDDANGGLTPVGVGLTGKEIVIETGHPLNCITPRFAPLRRKGLIKDSGLRRNKQIVWVLA